MGDVRELFALKGKMALERVVGDLLPYMLTFPPEKWGLPAVGKLAFTDVGFTWKGRGLLGQRDESTWTSVSGFDRGGRLLRIVYGDGPTLFLFECSSLDDGSTAEQVARTKLATPGWRVEQDPFPEWNSVWSRQYEKTGWPPASAFGASPRASLEMARWRQEKSLS